MRVCLICVGLGNEGLSHFVNVVGMMFFLVCVYVSGIRVYLICV